MKLLNEIEIELKNSNCDLIQKLKLWLNSKTQIVKKLKNSISDETQKNLNGDKTQKLKWWQNSKIQMVTKLKNSNYDKTQKPKLW